MYTPSPESLRAFEGPQGKKYTIDINSLETLSRISKGQFEIYFNQAQKDDQEISELKEKVRIEEEQNKFLQENLTKITTDTEELEISCKKLEAEVIDFEKKINSEKERIYLLNEQLNKSKLTEDEIVAIAKENLENYFADMNSNYEVVVKSVACHNETSKVNENIISAQQDMIKKLIENLDVLGFQQDDFIQLSDTEKQKIENQYNEDKENYLNLMMDCEEKIETLTQEISDLSSQLNFETEEDEV